MSIPTTEVLIFDTSEAYRNNNAIVNPAFDIACAADGCRKPCYYGVQIENPATGYIFLNWDSQAHQQAVIDGPSYGRLIEALTPAIGGQMKMYRVIFNDHPVAFEHPVTQVVVASLKDPSHRAELVGILTEASNKTEKRMVFGVTLEDENVYILVGGWASVEAHLEIVGRPGSEAVIERVFTLTGNDRLFHTSLTPYVGK